MNGSLLERSMPLRHGSHLSARSFQRVKNATIPRYLSTILKVPLLFGRPLQPKALLYGSNAIVLFTNAG